MPFAGAPNLQTYTEISPSKEGVSSYPMRFICKRTEQHAAHTWSASDNVDLQRSAFRWTARNGSPSSMNVIGVVKADR